MAFPNDQRQSTKVQTQRGQRWLAIPAVLAGIFMLELVIVGNFKDPIPPSATPMITPSATPTLLPLPNANKNDEFLIMRSSLLERPLTEVRSAYTGEIIRTFNADQFVLAPHQQTLFVHEADSVVAYRTFTGEKIWTNIIGDTAITSMIMSKVGNRLGVVQHRPLGVNNSRESFTMLWLDPADGHIGTQYELFDYDPRFAPFLTADGRTLLYVSTQNRLEIVNSNGNSWFNLTSDMIEVVPNDSATRLMVLAGQTPNFRVDTYDVQEQKLLTSVTVPLNECENNDVFNLDPEPLSVACQNMNRIMVLDSATQQFNVLNVNPGLTAFQWIHAGDQILIFSTELKTHSITRLSSDGSLIQLFSWGYINVPMTDFAFAYRPEPQAMPQQTPLIVNPSTIPTTVLPEFPTIPPNSPILTMTLQYSNTIRLGPEVIPATVEPKQK